MGLQPFPFSLKMQRDFTPSRLITPTNTNTWGIFLLRIQKKKKDSGLKQFLNELNGNGNNMSFHKNLPGVVSSNTHVIFNLSLKTQDVIKLDSVSIVYLFLLLSPDNLGKKTWLALYII